MNYTEPMENALLKGRRSRIILILLILSVLIGAWSFNADKTTAASGSAEQTGSSLPDVTFADDSRYTDVRQIELNFYDTADHMYIWSFPYSDDFFRYPSNEFSRLFHQCSLGFAISAFRNDETGFIPTYPEYFAAAGFTDTYSFGYDKPTSPDSLAGVIAHKRIDDTTVIAAAACGAGYGKEWSSNLKVGTGERHEGFNNAAMKLEDQINTYIKEHNLKGKKKLWISGYSRASAIANITAADMIESGSFEDVYAYLTAVPRTTKKPVAYPGIFNVCGKNDFVTCVPLQAWGFYRYGTTLFTPSQEADSNYAALAYTTSKTTQKLAYEPFRNNPELSYQFHLVLSFFGFYLPTAEDYANLLQDDLMKLWTEPDYGDVFGILATAMSRSAEVSAQKKIQRDVFVDYLSFVASQHLKAHNHQIEDGSWNPDDPTADNVVLEHRPMTYISWLFSDNSTEDVYCGPTKTRRVVFIGDVGVDILQGNRIIASIDRNGRLSEAEDTDGAGADSLPVIFMMREGKETTVSIPSDNAYTIQVTAGDRKPLTYYDLSYDAYNVIDKPGMMYVGNLSEGSYKMTIDPDKDLPELASADPDSRASLAQIPYRYSPVDEMDSEMKADKNSFLSVGEIIKIIVRTNQFMLLLFAICLIIYLIHRRGVKKGHVPYSSWFVIIPHLIVIAVFAALTQLCTYYLFAISQAMTQCAAITFFVIFLLSIRGLIRNRSKRNLLLTITLAAVTAAVFLFYRKLPLVSFSLPHLALFTVIVAGFTVLAIRSFRVSSTPDQETPVDEAPQTEQQ